MKTCNGCEFLTENVPAQVSLSGQIVYVAVCDYFYTCQEKGVRIIKQYWGDSVIPTPDWCPKEDSNVY